MDSTDRDVLEKKLEDPTAPPIYLPLQFLKDITCNFSTETELGRGGYGVVYKGVLRSQKFIAVKKLFEIHLMEDDQFQNEVSYLMGIRHQNVVQLVGYCAESRWEATMLPSGKYVMAQIPTRLLCFEYLCNKSLDKHVTDESSGLDWCKRYDIIKGICSGLCFLHADCHIVHLDLKPENILMDATMVPKIADFGLSRLLGAQKSRTIISGNFAGSLGYMAPEYLLQGVVSPKADIFGLGVIIIEIITGCRDYPQSTASYFQNFDDNDIRQSIEISHQKFIDKVIARWRNIFQTEPKYTIPEIYTQQVKQCISIALQCVDHDLKKRPNACDIFESFSAVETTHCRARDCKDSLAHEPRNMIIHKKYPRDIYFMSVHPAEEWIVTHHRGGSVHMWDCHTQRTENNSLKVLIAGGNDSVYASVFIAQKQWLLTGHYSGYIKVYSYKTIRNVKTFRAHGNSVSSLDIHPTEPYVLSASPFDELIKLWNWEKGWECVRTFGAQHNIRQLKFNPFDADYFGFYCHDGDVQIWNIGSSSCEFELTEIVDCFDYFKHGDQLYMITGHHNASISVWDWQSRARVKTYGIKGHQNNVRTVCAHPELPILITGSQDGTVRWWKWNSLNLSLEGRQNCGLGSVGAIVCLKRSRRIVIGHEDGLAVTEI